jgi:hypothetical protein
VAGICALHDDDFYMPKSLCNAQWIERERERETRARLPRRALTYMCSI